MEAVVTFIIGILMGVLSMYLYSNINDKDIIGTIRIDKSDPYDNPYLFLELSKSIDVLEKKKQVTLKVNTISYIPHK